MKKIVYIFLFIIFLTISNVSGLITQEGTKSLSDTTTSFKNFFNLIIGGLIFLSLIICLCLKSVNFKNPENIDRLNQSIKYIFIGMILHIFLSYLLPLLFDLTKSMNNIF